MTVLTAALLPDPSSGPWDIPSAGPADGFPIIDYRAPVAPADDGFGRHRPAGLPGLLLALGAALPASRGGRAAGRVLGPVVRVMVPWLYGSVIDVAADGLRRRLHVRDHADDRRFLALPRQAAAQARAHVAAALPAEGVFVDVGAGTGLHTLAAARHLGPQGRVLAVEPNAATRDRLAVNLSLNPIAATVTLVEEAVGPTCDGLVLATGTRKAATALPAWDAPPPALVRTRPLLDLARAAGLRRVDVLRLGYKAGADLALIPFLQAAPHALRPRLIVVDRCGAKGWGVDLPATLALFGYRACGGTPDALLFQDDADADAGALWEPADWSLVAS
ncbi:FkbM family methyltransferase [Nitrospirillum sp. BR 11164]|uniref:FkbM family methyltransferase n=1 Tax=Nitrospirillum sp. BR 11164 TaxID=3104324 RepID=UPI002AFE7667|nr:FkbM family methyltransferase [Nitrospirillum sp. BR 11164]MEA1653114.1 FkbM family methyltransferase [Nitrospirillum sp. BR 11164]